MVPGTRTVAFMKEPLKAMVSMRASMAGHDMTAAPAAEYDHLWRILHPC